MPTWSELVLEGRLLRVEADLDPDCLPRRVLLAIPRVAEWSSRVLPTLESDGYVDGSATPAQQADAYISLFIGGGGILSDIDKPPHIMSPKESHIWVLRTPDLRFFGWFLARGIFIISAADTKQRCKKYSLATSYVRQAVHDRNGLPLDDPKYVEGDLHDLV